MTDSFANSVSSAARAGKLHISEETRRGLGFVADRILEWTHGKEVLVVSTHDISQEPVARWRISLGAVGKQLSQLREKIPTFNFRRFFWHGSLPEGEFVKELLADDASCTGNDKSGHCIIMGRTDHSLRWFFARSTGIPEDQLEHVDGTAGEFNLIVAAHECGHTDKEDAAKPDSRAHGKNAAEVATMSNEARCDRSALSHYFEELALGTVRNPEVPLIWRDYRAITAMTSLKDKGHSIGPALYLPGEIPGPVTDPARESAQMHKALTGLRELISCAFRHFPMPEESPDGKPAGDEWPAYYRKIYWQFDRMMKLGSFDNDYYEKRYVTQFLEAIQRRAPSLVVPASPAPQV